MVYMISRCHQPSQRDSCPLRTILLVSPSWENMNIAPLCKTMNCKQRRKSNFCNKISVMHERQVQANKIEKAFWIHKPPRELTCKGVIQHSYMVFHILQYCGNNNFPNNSLIISSTYTCRVQVFIHTSAKPSQQELHPVAQRTFLCMET